MGATNRALATDLSITLVTVCQLVSLYVKSVEAQLWHVTNNSGQP
jgi:hypothetical protein